ncbi:MAG: iron ABC transporter permease [Chloroflexi bacterium]|nr:iron ABC transporter permease [Chloroflexota bacterium]
MPAMKQGKHGTYILLALGSPLVILVVVPLFLLLLNSFRSVSTGQVGFALDRFTLHNYVAAYSNAGTWTMLTNSLVFAVGSTAGAFFLGGAMAFLVERTDIPFRRFTYGMMFVPLIIPGMLLAVAWVLLLSPHIGLINKVWMTMGANAPLLTAYSMPAMWFVQSTIGAPLTFVLIGSALRRMDSALEEAAITCGASKVKVATQITARLIMPAIAGVALLQFILALEALEVPLVLGLDSGLWVFSTNIMIAFQDLPPNYGLGFSYSVILILLTMCGLFIYQKVMKSADKYVVVTGKGYRPRIMSLGKLKALGVTYQVLFALVTIVLPLSVLVWASLLRNYQVPSSETISQVNLNNYVLVFARSDIVRMLVNTVILASVVAGGVVVLSLLLSWVIYRARIRGRAILDTLSFLPYTIPAIAMGIAYMVVFLSFKNPIYGTIWILVIAYVVRFLPYGTRFTHSGMTQVHKELEEAAKVSGASFWTMFLRVVVPLMKPTIIGCGLYLFILSVKIFSIAVFLSSPKSMVFSMQIYQLWQEGRFGVLGALAVIMIGSLGILAALGGPRMGKMLG